MKNLAGWIVCAGMMAVGLAGAAQAAYFHPEVHKITTQFRGDKMCLGPTINGAKVNRAQLTSCAGMAVQNFFIKANDKSGKFFRVESQFRDGMCLDVTNGGPGDGKLAFAPCGNYSGQVWEFRPQAVPGSFQLASTFRKGQCADIVNGGADNNGAALAPCANVSGQIWTFATLISGLPVLASAPAPTPSKLAMDAKTRAMFLALPKNRDIIITSGDQELEEDYAWVVYKFLKSRGYDLDEPDRLLMTSTPQSTITISAKDPEAPIQVRVGRTATFTQITK